MIFTRIFINNLFCFHNTEVDFTFARKLKDSTIEDEHLEGVEGFKYKRVAILTGANASGKTAFGRVLCGIQNYVAREGRLIDWLQEGIANRADVAEIKAEFVTQRQDDGKYILHYLHLVLHASKIVDQADVQEVNYYSTIINPTDSNYSSRKRLTALIEGQLKPRRNDSEIHIDYLNRKEGALLLEDDFVERVSNVVLSQWYYRLSELSLDNSSVMNHIWSSPDDIYKILHAFDSSIEKVTSIKSENDGIEGFKIIFKNGDEKPLLIKNGQVTMPNPNRLSRGTHEAINMALLYTNMLNPISGSIFYVDEQMAYCHAEMEQALLNLLIDKLPPDSQLFYTTHNYDILDMNLPMHSHYVFTKEDASVQVINIGDHFKKNDRSLAAYLKNDALSTLPDTTLVHELL